MIYLSGRWVAYHYDAQGRRDHFSDSTGAVTNYVYDAAGRLWKVLDGSGTQLVEYKYKASGRLDRINKGNGTYRRMSTTRRVRSCTW